ncbi:AP-5 complex subunit zeta-1, partial [Podarcis lilfordi]
SGSSPTSFCSEYIAPIPFSKPWPTPIPCKFFFIKLQEILSKAFSASTNINTALVFIFTSSFSKISIIFLKLSDNLFSLCFRLPSKEAPRALKKADGELQKACLIEAITIMDIICRQDSSYVYRSLSCLKNVHSRISGDLSYARVLLPIAQFFLNHSE